MTKVRGAVAVLSVVAAVALLGMGSGVWGQEVDSQPRTFGASTVIYTVPAWMFVGNRSTDTYSSARATRSCAIADCQLGTSVLLPAGAVVTSIEVDGCDQDASGDFTVDFLRTAPHDVGLPTTLATATSSGGCVYTTAILGTPETIDNRNNLYLLRFSSPVVGGDLRLVAVRLFYTLQVSPAPAVASFGDVPTNHPFFRFIEALKASGITSGCQSSPPLYCPDQALTRGQMAVFLSTALGLHFAP
jgi:hypothetical protein